jgi:hypothetical protein
LALHPQVRAFISATDPSRPKLHELAPAAARAQAAGAVSRIGPGPDVPAEGVKSDTHRARVQSQADASAVEPGATALDDRQARRHGSSVAGHA